VQSFRNKQRCGVVTTKGTTSTPTGVQLAELAEISCTYLTELIELPDAWHLRKVDILSS